MNRKFIQAAQAPAGSERALLRIVHQHAPFARYAEYTVRVRNVRTRRVPPDVRQEQFVRVGAGLYRTRIQQGSMAQHDAIEDRRHGDRHRQFGTAGPADLVGERCLAQVETTQRGAER